MTGLEHAYTSWEVTGFSIGNQWWWGGEGVLIQICEPNKRNNTKKREIRRIGYGNTLFYRPYIDEYFFLKMYISVTKVSYNKIQNVIDVHVYK